MTFTVSGLDLHIKTHHPGCPRKAREALIAKIIVRDWRNLTMGNAVGITMENYLRHEISGYDNLLRLGVGRDEARRLIRPQVNAILQLWRNPSAPELTQPH